MRFLPFLLLLAPMVVMAHSISISTGELTVEGNRAKYELRMPIYELPDARNAEPAIFGHISFSADGAAGKMVEHSCQVKGETFFCTATYEFAKPPEQIEAECTFARMTVANHIHVLKARMGDKTDQFVFDLATPKTTLRFRQATAAELAVEQIVAGAVRAFSAYAGILFLFGMALAARSMKEMGALVLAFVLGEAAACVIMALRNPELSPRFIEAATALTVAYLAVEIVFLPQAGTRWLICGVLGLFHGFYFAVFIRDASYRADLVLTGAIGTELVILAFCRGLVMKFPGAVRVASMLLMAVGLGWFGLRLIR